MEDPRELLADALRYKAFHDSGRPVRPGEIPAWDDLSTEWKARWLRRADQMIGWLEARGLTLVEKRQPATSAVSSPGPYPKGGL